MSAAVSQELIPLTAPERWQAALRDVPHAFGHTWESCYAMQLTTGYPTYLYVWQRGAEKVVCPLAERTYHGFTDVVTPYGFSGFVGTAAFADFMDDWYRFAAQAGYVCGYVGLNPVLAPAADPVAAPVLISNVLYVIPLQPSLQEIYQRLSSSKRNQLRRIEKLSTCYQNERQALQAFFLVQYHTFITQKKATVTYHFSLATLSYLINSEQVFLRGYAEAGAVKAVAVFAHTKYTGEYLFSLSLPGYEHQATPLLWHGIRHLKEKQVPYLNLGGGVQPGDSLASFKQRFGALELPLSSLKQVYQQAPYTTLCAQAGVALTTTHGYFPPYRLPNAIVAP